MAPSAHSRIATSIAGALHARLSGTRCQEFNGDFQLFVEEAQLGTYPDVSVCCGPIRYWRDRSDVGTNPSVLVEVLSPSTAGFDRGQKFEAYKVIPSLQAYVLVSQDRPVVEVFARSDDGAWIPSAATGLAAEVALPGIGTSLALREIFERVDFAPA